MRNKYILIFSILLIFTCILATNNELIPKLSAKDPLPLIAIANYGPHSSLDQSISGIKSELALQGYIEHKNIEYMVVDVGFDTSLIPQMIANLKTKHP